MNRLLTDNDLNKLMLEYNKLSQGTPHKKFGLVHCYLIAQDIKTHQKDAEWLVDRIKLVTKAEAESGKSVLLPIKLTDWKIFVEDKEVKDES